MMINRETFFDYASGNPFFKIDLKDTECLGNPSASYFAVNDLVEMIRDTKDLIRELFGCNSDDEIIFTSGASESNSLALQEPFECSIYNHASIKENPHRVDYSPYKAVTLVDSELGKIHDIHNASHIDVTQAVDLFVNKDYSFKDLKANTLSFSGYKIGALQGIGVLIVKKDYFKELKPLIYGKQQNGLRGGTLNTLGILSLKRALEFRKTNSPTYFLQKYVIPYTSMSKLKDYGVEIVDHEKTNIALLNFTNCKLVKNYDVESLMHIFEIFGIICGIGSACNGNNKSEVYTKEFGENYKIIRFSIDRYENSGSEVYKALNKILDFLEKEDKTNGK